jgi:hypothetical protein
MGLRRKDNPLKYVGAVVNFVVDLVLIYVRGSVGSGPQFGWADWVNLKIQ